MSLSGLNIYGGMGQLGVGRGGGGVGSWWLAGGISASACVAAYQPKGAASYADSLKNLNNPGTGDAYEGTAPSWSAGGGWDNTGGSGYLWGANIYTVKSVIVRYGAVTGVYGGNQTIFGRYQTSGMLIGKANGKFYWANCSTEKSSGSFNFAGGVVAIAGSKTYINGAVDLTDLAVGSRVNVRCTLMATDNWVVQYRLNGGFIAAALYNALLTDPQVAAVTSAMQAL